jgi:hypothetical protein
MTARCFQFGAHPPTPVTVSCLGHCGREFENQWPGTLAICTDCYASGVRAKAADFGPPFSRCTQATPPLSRWSE